MNGKALKKILRGKFRYEAIRIMNRANAIDVNKLNENQLFRYKFKKQSEL